MNLIFDFDGTMIDSLQKLFETRDIEAAQSNDIYSIAVTWGFNSEKILLQHQPHYIARKPEDILAICGVTQKISLILALWIISL
jgi:phosphoglycolate phosphatase-like HAD superfamily hydrolase